MAGGTPLHLVGHSYGGAVAIRVALSSPAQVRSLTLIEPMVNPLLRWAGEEALYTETVSVVEPFLAVPMGDGADAAWRARHGPLPRLWDLGAPSGLHADGAFGQDAGRHRTLPRDAVQSNKPGRLPSPSGKDARPLRQPHGRARASPVRDRRRLIPGCSFSLVEGAGHMSPLTHPAAVATMLRAHLRGRCIGGAEHHAPPDRALAMLAPGR
jgi:lipase